MGKLDPLIPESLTNIRPPANGPRRGFGVTSIRGSGILLCFISALLIHGCANSPQKTTSKRAPSGSGFSSETRYKNEKNSWSRTLTYGGVSFRFELPPGEENAKPVFGYEGRKDFIQVQQVRVFRDRNRFKVGPTYFRWDPTSIIWIHIPPRSDRPFHREQGSLRLTCLGEGKFPVIEEQTLDQRWLWTVGNARVELDANGTVHYTFRGKETLFRGPHHLILGPNGESLDRKELGYR
mgnify:FL=1